MKRSTLVLIVVLSTCVIGCGAATSDQIKTPPKGYAKGSEPKALTPEATIAKLETSDERVTYLHQLGKDSSFEPQKHADMLQKYAGDTDHDVATAAKDLLDRIGN